VNGCDDVKNRELPGTSSVGWERVLFNVSELWDINGNGPALTGPSLNKLLMKDKTGFVDVGSMGARSTRNGTEL
jgi:hypothetical protein